jgi:hypothetical protein
VLSREVFHTLLEDFSKGEESPERRNLFGFGASYEDAFGPGGARASSSSGLALELLGRKGTARLPVN